MSQGKSLPCTTARVNDVLSGSGSETQRGAERESFARGVPHIDALFVKSPQLQTNTSDAATCQCEQASA